MEIQKKHSLAIRWFHWVNFPMLIIMTWSGLLIYWANDVYRIEFAGATWIKFFPEIMYESLNLSARLAEGMAFHFVFMWLFMLNGFLYVVYTLVSGEWRQLVPDKKTLNDVWTIIVATIKLKRSKIPLNGKYNVMQRIAYMSIIFMGAGSVFTGLAIYKPVQLGWMCALFGGYEMSRMLHFALTLGYVLFFLIHVVQVIRAGWNNFQAMITGFEKKTSEADVDSQINTRSDQVV